MTANLYDRTVATFRSRKASMRCADASKVLKDLGFYVKDGKAPGHKVYTHPGLPDFISSSFNCDHGKNPQIKPAYITKILKVLTDHETALRAYLESQDD